jgi:hypothetical protein
MRILFMITLLLFTTGMTAEVNITEIRDVLKHVETNHNPEALGDYNENGVPTSYGILQISKAAVDDVNRRYKTTYKHQDAFNIDCSEEIFKLYIEMWSERLERVEGRKITDEDVVRIWNGGPNGYKRKSTLPYHQKYKYYHHWESNGFSY